jgi:hypothetical protein
MLDYGELGTNTAISGRPTTTLAIRLTRGARLP